MKIEKWDLFGLNDGKKTEQIAVKITPKLKKALEEITKNTSDYIRYLILSDVIHRIKSGEIELKFTTTNKGKNDGTTSRITNTSKKEEEESFDDLPF